MVGSQLRERPWWPGRGARRARGRPTSGSRWSPASSPAPSSRRRPRQEGTPDTRAAAGAFSSPRSEARAWGRGTSVGTLLGARDVGPADRPGQVEAGKDPGRRCAARDPQQHGADPGHRGGGVDELGDPGRPRLARSGREPRGEDRPWLRYRRRTRPPAAASLWNERAHAPSHVTGARAGEQLRDRAPVPLSGAPVRRPNAAPARSTCASSSVVIPPPRRRRPMPITPTNASRCAMRGCTSSRS